MNCWSARGTALLLAAALSGCSQTMRVSSQVDPTASWQTYRRYAWASAEPHIVTRPGPPKNFTQLDTSIRIAVETALAGRGYIRDEFEDPDFLVNYQMVFRDKTTDTIQDYYWYRRMGGDAFVSEAFAMGYEEATLHLELTAPQTGWVFWRAAATTVANPKTQAAQINEAVRLMFEKVPSVGGQPIGAKDQ